MMEKHWRNACTELLVTPDAVAVTFEVPARPEVHSVALLGEFNGWSPTDHLMTRVGTTYRVTVELAVGRRYRFKYLVNGERWENDWAADDYVANEHGGDDSVLDLVAPPWITPERPAVIHGAGAS